MELPDREEFEARFARRFAKLSRQHRRKLRRYLGNPPRIENVPESFWEQVNHDIESLIYADLYETFLASAQQHGWGEPETDVKALGDMFRRASQAAQDAALAAYGWAKKRAEDFARYWTDSTRERIRQGIEDAASTEKPAETTIEESRRANESIQQPEPEPVKIDDILDDAFGPSRIEMIASDEVTRARHAGSETAIEATVGLSDDDVWETNPPRVCKTCMALDGKRRSEWPWRFEDGPPAHPRCKCNVRYANSQGRPKPTNPQTGPDDDRMNDWFDRIRGQKTARKFPKIRRRILC